MKTFTILLNLILAVASIHADECNFQFNTPVSYDLVYDQSVAGTIGNEAIADSWKYELEFALVMRKTIDDGICVDVTLRRFILTLLNAKGIRAYYDSSTPAKSIPIELNDILDSTLFLNFPSRYESRNGRLTAEKNNHPFQQYLKDLSDKSSVALIKEVMQATGNFWFLNEKNNMVSLLSSILNPHFSSFNKGGQQVVNLQAMPLFATFPLSKWSFLSSFEKALCLKTPSCLLFISDSSPTEIVGSWDEGFSSTIRNPNGSIKEIGTCKGTVKWNRTNFLLQERTWSWDNEVSDSQVSLKFSIKHSIKPKDLPKS
ncbi:MAG: hypothetical protein LLG04_17615 [Parachlamydia sp.]|nr:hypothetical protein [Parachlamydia sp.]